MELSWDTIYKDTCILATMLGDKKFTSVIAVTRGGLIPAAIVAQKLKLKIIDTVCLESYKGKERGDINMIKASKQFSLENKGADILIIDDLVDSGGTVEFLKKIYPKACFAVVYAKPKRKDMIDFFAVDVPQETWLVFPWEKDVEDN